MGEKVGDGAGRKGRHIGVMALKGITKGTVAKTELENILKSHTVKRGVD